MGENQGREKKGREGQKGVSPRPKCGLTQAQKEEHESKSPFGEENWEKKALKRGQRSCLVKRKETEHCQKKKKVNHSAYRKRWREWKLEGINQNGLGLDWVVLSSRESGEDSKKKKR